MLTESYLSEVLRKGVVKVTFRKIDGDIRVMDCTLNMDQVPPSQWPLNTSSSIAVEKYENPYNGTFRVYDVNAKGWRSFKTTNVIAVEHH